MTIRYANLPIPQYSRGKRNWWDERSKQNEPSKRRKAKTKH
jgi:hypothetical protein